MRPIQTYQRDIITKHIVTGFNEFDNRLPTALCGSCQATLIEYSNGNFTRHIELHDYSLTEPELRSEVCEG